MQVQQLESDIHVLVGETYRSNSVAFSDGDEVLLVDAMSSRRDAEDLRSFVEDELNKRVRFIICTHYFSDHLAGLKSFPQSRIVAHRNYRHTFDSELYRSDEERAHFVEPDILISDGLTVKWGRHVLDVFHNPGHTMSTLGIDVAEADLIIAGDNVVGDIAYLCYTSPQMLCAALERLRRRGRRRLVSGHLGARGGRAVDNALHYLRALREQVETARRDGSSEEAIRGIDLKACLAPEAAGSDFENIFHRRNLEAIVERNLFSH